MEIRKRIQAVQGAVFLLSSAMLCVPAMALWHVSGSSSTPALQEPQQPHTAPGAQQPDNSKKEQPDQQAAKAVVITGTIAKSGSDFTLRDANGNIYQLDAPDKAAPFDGKFVKVTGTLEASAKVLHVDAIEEVSA
ncbi:MAG: DUF5818 domain-containing protein [Terracidiphilus sp.]|nr:DUF5818 domain-containing protein [Terracidiphilus sp.]